MTNQDIADWKRHPCTQAMFSELRNMIEYGKEELVKQLGNDPILDAKKAGKILAYCDLLEIDLEDKTDE